MPILSRRSQSQYYRRPAGSGQSLNGDRRKRHNNTVHPMRSAIDSHNVTHMYHKGTSVPTLERNRTQMSQPHNVHHMTSLPEVNYDVNGSGNGPLCPVPPPSSPPLMYYCRPVVARQRRIPASNQTREREALKRQQRLQVFMKFVVLHIQSRQPGS